MKKIFSFCLAALLLACSSAKKGQISMAPKGDRFILTEISTDDTYGYTEKNPVKVGGVKSQSGPSNERRFLDALTGPNGEALEYTRRGSCCPFKTPNGFINNSGMLDIYEIKYAGLSAPVVIYTNMYDSDVLKAPKGFTFKN